MKHKKIYLVLALALTQSTFVNAQTNELVTAKNPTTENELLGQNALKSRVVSSDGLVQTFAIVDDESTTSENKPKSDENSTSDHAEEGHSEEGHEEEGHEEESEAGVVELSAESIEAAGIEVGILMLQPFTNVVTAPGEVQLNQYTSAEVTPLIDSVVVERHARLGDAVETGQRLATLASVEVAKAQGELRIAAGEWRRARNLGQSAVGAKRYTQAEVAYEQARLVLSAYGLDKKQVDQVATQAFKGTLGQFQLNAPLPGTILRDDFRVGQRIEAGEKLFLIADESQIWIKANLSPIQAQLIRVGVAVRVKMGGHWHNGEVIQKHHLLDEGTRTVPIRISVIPDGEHHHAGEFVTVSIDLSSSSNSEDISKSLVIPESGLMQNDAQNWTVFVQVKPGHFRQSVVTRGMTRGALVAITGLSEGASVVTDGAFFLASELAKSGFDIHDH